MKSKIGFILVLGLLVSLSFANISSASIVTVTDTTNFLSHDTDPSEDLVSAGGFYVNKLEGPFDWVMWTHHFDPPAEEPVSATLTVSLRDDYDGNCFFQSKWELGFGIAEDGTWDIGWVNTGSYVYNVTASYLTDGTFTVYLGSLLGDFFIDQSKLEFTTDPVPIPSSLILLLSGTTALMGFRRKIFST